MGARQTPAPEQWLIADRRLGDRLWPAVRTLPRGSGILLLFEDLPAGERARLLRRLRLVARRRGLQLIDAAGRQVARVHDASELRAALLSRTPLILLSPLFPTASHPEWAPLPRMRAAALARLGRRRLLGLGGMDSKSFGRVKRLGFRGWAGIDAFRT